MFRKPNKIVIASNNKGKLLEINKLLSKFNIIAIAQSEFDINDAEETGTTFIENAIIKARHASKLSGLPALADDSGVMVDAINGEPGVYSARYSADVARSVTDETNNTKLLLALQNISNRKAQFVCTMAFLPEENYGLPLLSHGIWHGEIANELSGEFGFGYDPLFYIPDLKKTAAQLTLEEKSLYSHRALALNEFFDHFSKFYNC